jgi:hypothetical protein
MKTNKCYCENCNKKVTYTTIKRLDTFEIDHIMVTCKQKFDICDECNSCDYEDCISSKSFNYNIRKGHRAYMRMLFRVGMFKNFFKHFWHDWRRFKL